jgi:hypothetical protein
VASAERKRNKAPPSGAVDYFGFPISPGDTVAAPVFMQGFVTYVRRKVIEVDAEGALVCTNMDGKPVNRVKNPKKTFKRHGEIS